MFASALKFFGCASSPATQSSTHTLKQPTPIADYILEITAKNRQIPSLIKLPASIADDVSELSNDSPPTNHISDGSTVETAIDWASLTIDNMGIDFGALYDMLHPHEQAYSTCDTPSC